MNEIKVNQITLIEKDIVEIDEYKDFELIYRDMFNSRTFVFNLNGMLYLLGSEVAYLHRR